MRQVSVLLAIASSMLHAKVRSEVMADPALELVGDASTPLQAIAQTRRLEPRIVLCDQDMLAGGQMAVLAQQTVVVSLLVLVTPDDETWLPRLSVPVAGTVSAHHRPGDLANKLKAIIDAPAASVEPALLQPKSAGPLDKAQDLKPLPYDPSQLPSLPAELAPWASLSHFQIPAPAGAYGFPAPKDTSLLKRVFGESGKL